jgi:hypothetical protein
VRRDTQAPVAPRGSRVCLALADHQAQLVSVEQLAYPALRALQPRKGLQARRALPERRAIQARRARKA